MTDFDPSTISGLNVEAFTRWVDFKRTVHKFTYKPISLSALAIRISKWPMDRQETAVDHCISNGYKGLDDYTQGKSDVSTKKTRTKEEQKDADATFEYCQRQSAKAWGIAIQGESGTEVAKIRLAAALLARYDTDADQDSAFLAEKRMWLKARVAELLRDAEPASILRDYDCKRLVLRLFNDAGLRRLEQRAQGG